MEDPIHRDAKGLENTIKQACSNFSDSKIVLEQVSLWALFLELASANGLLCEQSRQNPQKRKRFPPLPIQ